MAIKGEYGVPSIWKESRACCVAVLVLRFTNFHHWILSVIETLIQHKFIKKNETYERKLDPTQIKVLGR